MREDVTRPQMDHAHIEEADIVSRYVLRRLSADEERAFEEHFVDCPACLDRIDSTRRMRAGLAATAARVTGPLGSSGTRWIRPLALAAGVLIAVGLAAAVIRNSALHADLAGARDARAVAERETADARRQVADLQRQLDDTRRQQVTSPGTVPNIPVFALSLVRGGSETGPPQARISIPSPAPPVVVLLLDVGDSSEQTYRATLRSSGGSAVWQQSSLRGSPVGLAAGVPAEVLRPGDYVLLVDAQGRSGRPLTVGQFRFRIE